MIQRVYSFSPITPLKPKFGAEPPFTQFPDPPKSPFVTGGEAKNVPDPAKHLENIALMHTQGFRNQFEAVLDGAKKHLNTLLKTIPAQKLAVVMDLDETLLDNTTFNLMKLLRQKPHGYTYLDWTQSSQCSAIPESQKFVNWVLRKKMPLFFVTARVDNLRPATVENLRRIGLPPNKYTLYTKPNQDFGKKGTTSPFKIAVQQELVNKGFTIGAMIGDQQTDIDGALGQGFLLPNPMYTSH